MFFRCSSQLIRIHIHAAASFPVRSDALTFRHDAPNIFLSIIRERSIWSQRWQTHWPHFLIVATLEQSQILIDFILSPPAYNPTDAELVPDCA